MSSSDNSIVPAGAIDAHQHFWKYDPVRDSWITGEMSVLQRDFLPADLQSLLQQQGFAGCVVVQSDQSEAENAFQLSLAEQYDFIKGVVGWIDLRSAEAEERLRYWKQYKKLKGFRHILQGEPQRDLMLQPAFKRGISFLNRYGFTYDILIFPDQLGYSSELVRAFPDQPFVLDHMAKPPISKGEMEEWKKGIRELAVSENVCVKISGMVTEANLQHWKKEDLEPYMDVVVEAFGTDRILFGSDWPVCLLAADYAEVVEVTTNYFAAFSEEERKKFYGGNATRFYHL